ncbi:MAG TPA: hypothetical protein VF787_03930 [Thermoanaerobaculia bacterium]
MAQVRADEGDDRHPGDVEISARREEAGRDQNRFSFEKRPDENGKVSKLLEQRFRRHSGPIRCQSHHYEEIAAIVRRITLDWRQSMKRAWILPLAVAAALPLFAQETKSDTKSEAKPAERKAVEQTKAPAAAATTTAVQPAPAPVATADSPLVAAARRAAKNRTRAKGTVITNDTLATSGGNAHITTTANQAPVPKIEPRATTASSSPRKNNTTQQSEAKTAADKEKARAEAEQKQAQRAMAAEEGYDGGQGDDADEIVVGSDTPPPPQH